MLFVSENSSDDGPEQDYTDPQKHTAPDKLISCSFTVFPLLQLSRFLCSFLSLSFFSVKE